MQDERFDEKLNQLAGDLRGAPGTEALEALWGRLERALTEEAAIQSVHRRRRSVSRWAVLAAGLLIASSLWFLRDVDEATELLLSGEESRRLAGEVSRLDAAILTHAGELIEGAAVEARPEVFGQLEYLEDNIAHCRDLLLVNARSRDIQRSLLRSIQKKEELLRTLLDPTKPALEGENHETL